MRLTRTCKEFVLLCTVLLGASSASAFISCPKGALNRLLDADSCNGIEGHGLMLEGGSTIGLWHGGARWENDARFIEDGCNATIHGTVINDGKTYRVNMTLSKLHLTDTNVDPIVENQGECRRFNTDWYFYREGSGTIVEEDTGNIFFVNLSNEHLAQIGMFANLRNQRLGLSLGVDVRPSTSQNQAIKGFINSDIRCGYVQWEEAPEPIRCSSTQECPDQSCCSSTGYCGTTPFHCDWDQLDFPLDGFVSSTGGLRSLNWCGSKKVFALTIEASPLETITPLILQHLKEMEIVATFFVSPALFGVPSPTKCELVATILRAGHSIMPSNWDSKDARDMTAEQLAKRLARSLTWIRQCASDQVDKLETVQVFRPAFDQLNHELAQAVSSYGFVVASKTIDAWDLKRESPSTAAQILKNRFDAIVPGGGSAIFNVHELYYNGNSIATVVDYLKVKGYYFVKIGECYQSCGSSVCKLVSDDVGSVFE
jgi:peptidoglycan/xylan/chitin deacetylase (PgdA/CDA1 family)